MLFLIMKLLQIIIFFLLINSCSKQQSHPYGFYYWRTTLQLDSTEKKQLQNSDLPYLYTRFFDVDKNAGKLQPVGVASSDQTFATEKTVVPVIFITNRTFYQIKEDEIEFLAQSVSDLIKKKTEDFKLKPSPEIQIDCDWTAGTRDDYFKFLKKLKEISGKEITSTLRLHQVKDKSRMGIPPVSKVYLMCYSTTSPLDNSGKNSILDVQLLKNYLNNLQDYPLKNIDIALPVYSWGIVTNHVGKKKLINALSRKDLTNSNFRQISDEEAEVVNDGFYFGTYLNKGFKIKIEEIENAQLDEVVAFLNKKLTHYNIVYYHLDSKFVNKQNLKR